MSTIDKPCLRKCCLTEDDICLGCYRHLDAILAWSTYTEKEKILILSQSKILKENNSSKNNWYAFGSIQ